MKLWEKYGVAPDTRTPPWSIDYLHVEMLLGLLRLQNPVRSVEIGSHRGHSTVAFIEFLNDAPWAQLDIIEPKPTPELLELIGKSPCRDRIVVHPQPSWERPIPDADFVFIDGDHRWPALADLAWAMSINPEVCIAMHDTRSVVHGIESCWGAGIAAGILREAFNRTWFEDTETREGVWTHRGFGASLAIDPQGDHYENVKKLFRSTSDK